MFKISVQIPAHGLSDTYLTQVTQLGASCLDFDKVMPLPGVEERGYPNLDDLLQLKKRIQSFGLRINRVTLPPISEVFMSGRAEDDGEVTRSVEAMKIYAEAGIPIVRQRFAGSTFPQLKEPYKAVQRGGMISRGERLVLDPEHQEGASAAQQWWELGSAIDRPSAAQLDAWWQRFFAVYDGLVEVADHTGLKLAMHPSDTPNYHVPFDGLGLNRIIDRYPSPQVGFIYCVGTRAEAGGSSLVLDEINHFGRKGRIFLVHVRNVRGSLPTAGAFEETMLDDGDLNIFRILKELKKVGFSGCINPDHVPQLEGDTEEQMISWAYGIGYLKAMCAALVG